LATLLAIPIRLAATTVVDRSLAGVRRYVTPLKTLLGLKAKGLFTVDWGADLAGADGNLLSERLSG
jgi:hypothetical protein